MFIQIHMLQSMPPGNLNRDDTGQPKKCVFGGVTRGRISSQCLKRNIRHSLQFKEAFGDELADRTTYLPRMVADELRNDGQLGVPNEEIDALMLAIASKFKKEKRRNDSEEGDDEDKEQEQSDGSAATGDGAGQTGQLVFFPPPFARRIAELVAKLRQDNKEAYDYLLTGKMSPDSKTKTKKAVQQKKDAKDARETEKAENKKKKAGLEAEIGKFIETVATASKSLTVDIGLFGRMTTSDLVVNVEAACQVAHAISTHETMIESDWFTAMEDRKKEYATTQAEKAGAAYIGSGENVTFFNSAVYYKYLNLDVDALKKHLPTLGDKDAARAAGVLVSAAALANPTGKQNSFAAHGLPELILVEASKKKHPISYANAFLQPVEGGTGRNLMAESAKALYGYIDSVAAAFAPVDVRRVLLAVGHASSPALNSTHDKAITLDELSQKVGALVDQSEKGRPTA